MKSMSQPRRSLTLGALIAVAASPGLAQETDLSKARQAGGKVLTGPELRELYIGSTHFFERPGRKGAVYIAPNGDMFVKATCDGAPCNSRAKAGIEGNTWCNTSLPAMTRSCLTVVREGNVHKQFAPDGSLRSTITAFKKGNAEGL